jgi:CBS domain-containing protein
MDTKVKELMIPVESYPTVSDGASLFEAVKELEKAHQGALGKTYMARSVLVSDASGKIVGKISLWDCMKALEPKYGNIADFDLLTHHGINPDFLRSTVTKHGLWTDPLDILCEKAAAMQVKYFMSKISPDISIKEDAPLSEAVHHLVVGKLLSLLVVRRGQVVGLLRLCDIFEFISEKVKTCGL